MTHPNENQNLKTNQNPHDNPHAYPSDPGLASPGEVRHPAGVSGAAVQEKNGIAIAALIVGIVALVGTIFLPVALLAGIAAIVLGIIGLRRAKRLLPEFARRGMSIAGIVLGALSLLLSVLFAAIVGAAIFGFLNSDAIEACDHVKDNDKAFQECVTDYLRNDPDSPFGGQGSSK